MSDERDSTYYKAWMTTRNVSRRGLFRGLFGAAPKIQQEIEQSVVRRANGRPPQAVTEALFLHLCTGCNDCVSACPYGIISLKDTHPIIEIDFSACETGKCLKCTDVCSTGALSRDIIPDTSFHPTISAYCFGRKDTSCRMCVYGCPSEALTFNENNQPAIDENLCDGCGQCKTDCYHGYITLEPGIPRLTY
nr:4Fe-4S dicluster domain-containing protein [uncultured Moellerella sp.]